jgi:ribonuclease HI
LNAVHDALAAEGEACLAALNAAMDLGISGVAVETDSSNLVEALTSNKFDQAPGAVIFKELRMLLALHFVPTNISYVSHFRNQCALELARCGPLPNLVQSLLDRDLADAGLGK